MIFLNPDLFLAIDYGVLYLLDHPYMVVKERTPKSGDHKYLYYQRMTVGTRENIPSIHFLRLPTELPPKVHAQKKKKTVEVLTGARSNTLIVTFIFSHVCNTYIRRQSNVQVVGSAPSTAVAEEEFLSSSEDEDLEEKADEMAG
jgi:hypothetical protein